MDNRLDKLLVDG